MDKNIKERVIDISGVELTPGERTLCLGNGEQGFECCCDECDYYLLCFPEFDPQKEKEMTLQTLKFTQNQIPPLYDMILKFTQ